jgi:hypothetical protein
MESLDFPVQMCALQNQTAEDSLNLQPAGPQDIEDLCLTRLGLAIGLVCEVGGHRWPPLRGYPSDKLSSSHDLLSFAFATHIPVHPGLV